MPKYVPPRGQRRDVGPYDRLPRTRIASLWATNAAIKGIEAQLDTVKVEEEYRKVEEEYRKAEKENRKADCDLINEMVEVMLKHVKRLLNGFEDGGEIGQEELLLQLQMMNIRK
ncbi:hypothetical protein FSST1_011514 [Fusarium sambucinum]